MTVNSKVLERPQDLPTPDKRERRECNAHRPQIQLMRDPVEDPVAPYTKTLHFNETS